MRILFNRTTALFHQRTGIGHYTSELYRALIRHAAPDTIFGFPTGLMIRLNRVIACHCGSEHNCAIESRTRQLWADRPTGSRSPLAWLRWHLRRIRIGDRTRSYLCRFLQARLAGHTRKCLSRQGSDLYHEPNYVPVECELPTVVTVCDLSALLHPEWHPAERVAFFEGSFPKGLRQCVHVLTISEFSRREIVDTLGISPDRVTCTHLGVRDGMRALSFAECQPVLRRRELSWGQYLLYVGTIEPRKNIDTLMRAYCDLPSELRARCPLVLAGGWGWRAEKLRDLYETEARAKGVRHLGYVADAELPALYSGARALTFPSLYEGFGLPPLEMQACGGAVLASTAAAVAEVLEGSNAELIAPLDLTGWRDAMAKSVTDNDWLAAVRRGAEQHAARFTWDGCAQETLRVYRSLRGADLCQAIQLKPQAASLRLAG